MSSSLSETDSFAFTGGAYGNRPTYVLTPSQGEETTVTLYELMPDEIADARQNRFDRQQKQVSVKQTQLDEAINGGDTPGDVTTPNDNDDARSYQWGEWCAVELCSLSEHTVGAISGLIEDTLSAAGVDAGGIVIGQGNSVCLPESAGVRLTVAFKAIDRLRKPEKKRHIQNQVQNMSLGECYYWHSKIKSPREPNGVTALRELLVGHIN